MLHLKNVLRTPFNRMGDGLAVGWAEYKRAQDQHVQGPLDHFGLKWRFASWHSSPVVDRLEQYKRILARFAKVTRFRKDHHFRGGLPVPQPGDVLTVGSSRPGDPPGLLQVSYPDYTDLRNRSRSFKGLAAYTFTRVRFAKRALDYLLKPYDTARFFRVLSRAKALLAGRPAESRRFERIIVRSAGRISLLRAEESDWIEAADYYSCLHVGTRTHLLRRSMAELERDLEEERFCRIHRSTIVNLARVRDLQHDTGGEYKVALLDETRLKVSRGYREKLQTAIQIIGWTAQVFRSAMQRLAPTTDYEE